MSADYDGPTWDDARHAYEDHHDDLTHQLREARAAGDETLAHHLEQAIRTNRAASARLGRMGRGAWAQ